MSEKHLAERLMYPLPDGWRDDPEQVAALKEIWPKIITKNKELIDAEIASLRAQLDEAKAALSDIAGASWGQASNGQPMTHKRLTIDRAEKALRALLSESKT